MNSITVVGLSLVSILFNDYTCIELGKDLKFVSEKEQNCQK